MSTSILGVAWGILVEIGISQDAEGNWTYAPLKEGIESFQEDAGSQNQQYFFMSGEGYAHNEVTGVAPKYTVSGKRVFGDPAQNYIAGLKHQLGNARKTSVRISYTDASNPDAPETIAITCEATLQDISDIGGATIDNTPFNFSIALNGKPTVTNSATQG